MEITGGLGADEVLECSGGEVVPEQSIRCVKKGGRVSLIGFYDDTQVKISCMTKVVMDEIMLMGSRANPNTYDEVIRMFEAGAVKGDKIVTHRFSLEEYEQAMDTFVNRTDGAIKVVIEP
jgi:L-iditol 2-dehydrogenase